VIETEDLSGHYMRHLIPIAALCLVCAAAATAEMAVRIGRPIYASPAGSVNVDITFDNSSPGMAIGSFDLIMTHDSSLSLQTVVMGQLLENCDWEYFTYGTSIPNTIRIIAVADIHNGSLHPSCYASSSGTLARITFSVNADPDIVYDFLPIGFMWYDCGDNTFLSLSADTTCISHDVFDFDGTNEITITKDTTFPSPYGAPDACFVNERMIDFYNGGVHAYINDTTPPTALCPDNIITGTMSGQCGAEVSYEASVSDNNPGAIIVCDRPSGSYFPAGAATVTCLATDIFDNTDTCTFLVLVIDIEAPSAECPDNITVIADSGSCSAVVTYTASAADNCPGVSISCTPPSGSIFTVGTIPVTCIAADNAGLTDTCSFDVTVVDTEPPWIFCPEDLVFPADSGQCGADVTYEVTAADNCAGVNITCDPPSGSFFNSGITPVSCIAVDNSGNADTGNFNITVVDTEPPVAYGPDDITVFNDSGECGARVNFEATATDNCPGATITCDPPSGALFPTRPLPVICIAVDATGNADTTGFTMTVIDTQPPAVSAPLGLTAPNDPGQCGAVITFDPEVTDNCPNARLTCFPPSESLFPVGITSVTCIGFDISDNTDTAVFPVMVMDTTHPIVTCPGDIEVMNDSGAYGAVVNFDFMAYDNCPDVNVASMPPSGSSFDVGTTLVEIIAIDPSNNADTCQFEVRVILNDPDGDGFPNWNDNCPDAYNPDQTDTDDDGIGDTCDWRCGDSNGDDEINVGDAVFLINYVFADGPAPQPAAAGDANCDGQANISDAGFLINYIFRNGPAPDCPQ
jgi:hypothetical protein